MRPSGHIDPAFVFPTGSDPKRSRRCGRFGVRLSICTRDHRLSHRPRKHGVSPDQTSAAHGQVGAALSGVATWHHSAGRPQIAGAAQPNTEVAISSGKLKSLAAIIAAILMLTLVYLGAMLLAGAEVSAEPSPTALGATAPVGLVDRPCKTVTPRTFNRYVKRLDRITGVRHHKASRKVCKSKWRTLKRQIKQAKRDCLRKAGISGASWYGYADSGGLIGACGQHLTRHPYSFAVLRSGNVPSRCWQAFYFKGPNGHVIRAVQADTGGGGGPAGGYPRTFDFWAPAAQALGMTSAGLAAVTFSRNNCWA